jgi:predicted transcriptional regulator
MAEKIKVGVATHEELRERALQIARGERRRQADEPKIWFTSLESLAKVLSEPNRKLLRIIDESHPASLAELEVLSGRKASNLSRTLKTMSHYGLVKLTPGKRGSVAPEVLVRAVQMDLSLVG